MRGTPLTALQPQMADSPTSNLGVDTKENLKNRLSRCNFQLLFLMYLPITKCCGVRLQGATLVAVRIQQTLLNIIAADVCRVRPLWPSADKTIITWIGCGRPQGPCPATSKYQKLRQPVFKVFLAVRQAWGTKAVSSSVPVCRSLLRSKPTPKKKQRAQPLHHSKRFYLFL